MSAQRKTTTNVVRDSNGNKIGTLKLLFSARTTCPDADELDPTNDFADFVSQGHNIAADQMDSAESEDFFVETSCDLSNDPLDILIAAEEANLSFGDDMSSEYCEPYDELGDPPIRGKLRLRAKYEKIGSNITAWRMSCNEINCRERKCNFTNRRRLTVRGAHVSYIPTNKTFVAIPFEQR